MGRPLRSVLALFNNKHLKFDYHHLTSTDGVIIVDNFNDKIKKIKNFKEYESLLKVNKISLKQEDRKNNVLKKFKSICKSKSYIENFNEKLIEEVVNITENPSVIIADFDKSYLTIPQEIIISTLERHQRYFPLFDSKNRLTNHFLIVANRPTMPIRSPSEIPSETSTKRGLISKAFETPSILMMLRAIRAQSITESLEYSYEYFQGSSRRTWWRLRCN